jgi:hypothetical protein
VLILVSGATATRRKVQSRHLGCLIVPGSGNTPFPRKPWAADNGAFTGFDAEAFVAMLERLRDCEDWRQCLFVAAPDVVGDAAKTLAKFSRWARVIRDGFGFPVAFVAQNGQRLSDLPWLEFDALFLGGSPECVPCGYVRPKGNRNETCPICGRKLTEWKLGAEAETLARSARANLKWVHMGRVNTLKRVKHAARIGCDSFDGTTFSKWSDKYIPKGIAWVEQSQRQPHLL